MEKDPEEITRSLMQQAEILFGKERAKELQPELEVMADQLATLRTTPVELLDEP